MSTPVHDDDDVSGVTSSGASPEAQEVREVSAVTEPVPPTAAKPAEADQSV
jgi:hypothetical protein